MTAETFIKQKAKPLVFYVNQLLAHAIPFSEVRLMVWDILEEWNKLDIDDSPASDYELVFWNLLFLLQCWPEEEEYSQGNVFINTLNKCCHYLTKPYDGAPADCLGVRP